MNMSKKLIKVERVGQRNGRLVRLLVELAQKRGSSHTFAEKWVFGSRGGQGKWMFQIFTVTDLGGKPTLYPLAEAVERMEDSFRLHQEDLLTIKDTRGHAIYREVQA